MIKKLTLILVLVLFPLLLAGCSFSEKVSTYENELPVDLSKNEGTFFVLERLSDQENIKEYVEVSYDGKVKLKTGETFEKVTTVTNDELKEMYGLIKDKDYDELKNRLQLDGHSETGLKETLTVFTKEGQREIFNLQAEDLSTQEKTILPDSWDVGLGKVRRFLGTLTGEKE